MTVEGGTLRKPAKRSQAERADLGLPTPQTVALDRPFGVFIAGVGGTGVVTIGQLLGMAAHLENKGCSVLDMAGLAQKGGAVHSHVVLAATSGDLLNTRVAMGEADLVLLGDLVVGTGTESLARMRAGRTNALLNSATTPTADFITNPDWRLSGGSLQADLALACGPDRVQAMDASDLAVRLLGDGIYANPMMLGFAFQKGWLPLGQAALERAIELNGTQVANNLAAFAWGRRAAHDLADVYMQAGVTVTGDSLSAPAKSAVDGPGADDARARRPDGLQVIELRRGASASSAVLPFKAPARQDNDGRQDDWKAIHDMRAEMLVSYQNAAYARQYTSLVEQVAQAELAATGTTILASSVARYYFKLMAYKDEYEVARLYSDGEFLAKIDRQFEGNWSLKFHLAPPLFSKRDAQGHLIKKAYGPSMLKAFGVLARLRALRGTPLDIFGYTVERRAERALIASYRDTLQRVIRTLDAGNLQYAVDLAKLPEEIRGYGHVKEAAMLRTAQKREQLLAAFDAPAASLDAVRAA